MGPNGSGKSTLAYSVAGHPKYTVTAGTVTLDGEDVLAMSVDERARAGLFLAMQYPVEVPGVTVSNFLRTAKTAIDGEAPNLRHWIKDVRNAMDDLRMDPAFAERNVNEGFSGGEKKRHEILQLELLKPHIAILDETDSGLDVDALKVVSEGVNRVRESGDVGVLLITHYTRILRYIEPDFVHVFVDGRIAERAALSWPTSSRTNGYDRFLARGCRRPEHGCDPRDPQAARRRAACRKDFPILGAAAARATGRWSTSTAPTRRRSRRPCWTRSRTTSPAQRQRGPRRAPAGRRGDRGVRGRAGRRRALHRSGPPEEVVFTKNATEALNLVARVLGDRGRGPPGAWVPATRSSSPSSSTTRTSCRGSSSARAPGRGCGGSG